MGCIVSRMMECILFTSVGVGGEGTVGGRTAALIKTALHGPSCVMLFNVTEKWVRVQFPVLRLHAVVKCF